MVDANEDRLVSPTGRAFFTAPQWLDPCARQQRCTSPPWFPRSAETLCRALSWLPEAGYPNLRCPAR